jgi:tungstate transport system permease protein
MLRTTASVLNGGFFALSLPRTNPHRCTHDAPCPDRSSTRMPDLAQSIIIAWNLILTLDSELIGIVALSLFISLSATFIALMVGAPLGSLLAVARFPGQRATIVVVNALLGLPPVVVGLMVYLLLSRSGPLGRFVLLFTPAAMIVAQSCSPPRS